MFESTRLAAAYLEAAYARIVPTPWRRTRGASVLHEDNISSLKRYDESLVPAREVRHG